MSLERDSTVEPYCSRLGRGGGGGGRRRGGRRRCGCSCYRTIEGRKAETSRVVSGQEITGKKLPTAYSDSLFTFLVPLLQVSKQSGLFTNMQPLPMDTSCLGLNVRTIPVFQTWFVRVREVLFHGISTGTRVSQLSKTQREVLASVSRFLKIVEWFLFQDLKLLVHSAHFARSAAPLDLLFV